MRRVGSIAIVHETLSHAPDEIVDFDDVAERVAAMAGRCPRPRRGSSRSCSAGSGCCPPAVATPLALVLTELLQNALQHGLAPCGLELAPDAGPDGLLEVSVARSQERLTVIVQDNGVGLPEEFDWLLTRASACRSSGRSSCPSWAAGSRSSRGRAAARRPWWTCRWTRGPRYRPGAAPKRR